MKQTITEIFIEIEEIIRVKSAARKNSSDETTENTKPVIEICPHCGHAIFDSATVKLEGDLEI